MLFILTLMVFAASLGLSISAFYFLVEAPATRRSRRARIATVQQLYITATDQPQLRLLREDLVSEIPFLNRILLRFAFVVKLQTLLHQAAIAMTAGTLLSITLCLGITGMLAGLVIGLPVYWAFLIAAGTAALPYIVVAVKRQQRLAKFEELFPDAIDLLARAVRAGHAFTTGFELISQELSEPVAGEFQITFEQQNLGMPLPDALDGLARRVPVPDVRFFVSALQIQRNSGGNLAEILDKLSFLIRERFKILRQVKVYTAEGRMSLYILTAIPPMTAAFMFLANRDYMMTLFVDPTGQKVLALAVVLQVMGYLVIREITKLKV